MAYDILIRNAKVVTGTGAPWIEADIGIKNGIVERIGYLPHAQADRVIDAQGLFAAPGFIDMHNHSDLAILSYPEAGNALLQGVTTLVIGNCGFSAAPVLPERLEVFREHWARLAPFPVEITWSSFAEYLRVVEEKRPGVNIAPLVGHNTVRLNAMGIENRAPTEGELEEMRRLVAEAMEAGAFGMSTGLIYVPGVFSRTEEIVELAKVVAHYGGIYATHMRSESDRLVEAVEEALRIGREAGVQVEISHLKAAGRENWGKVRYVLSLVEDARFRGLEVTCDAYPYTAGMTGLSALLPPWALEGGPEEMLRRLEDPSTRRRIIDELVKGAVTGTSERLAALAGWRGIVIAYSDSCKECEGRSIAEIASMWGEDPAEAMLDLLLRDRGRTSVVLNLMNQDDVDYVVTHPLVMIGSDSWVAPPRGKPHPRFFGTFPRVIRRYVVEKGVLTLEEAVRKMSAMPATKLGLWDRGLLLPGFAADIVVFSLEEIRDRASYENPTEPPSGVRYVIVNGEVAVEDGELTGARAGRVLRRREF